jgi:FkbM family methyltransferase
MAKVKGLGNKSQTIVILLTFVSFITASYVWNIDFHNFMWKTYFQRHPFIVPIGKEVVKSHDSFQYIVNCDDYRNDTTHDRGRYVKATNTTPSFPMKVHLFNNDVVVSKAIFQRGCFNCGILTAAMKYLQEDNNSILLDIGSNIGLFALNAAAMGHQAFAFEPHQKNWLKICGTLGLGENAMTIKPNLTLFGVALSKDGPTLMKYQQQFERNPSAMMITSLNNNTSIDKFHLGIDYGWAISLDSLQDILPLDRPVVLKVDVEGHECEALSGALEYLRKVKIIAAFVEFTGDKIRNCDRLQTILDLFLSKGLLPHRIHDNEQVSSVLNVTRIVPSSETYWHGDYQFSKDISS